MAEEVKTDVKSGANIPQESTSNLDDVEKSLEGMTEEQLKELGKNVDSEIQTVTTEKPITSAEDGKNGTDTKPTDKSHVETVPYERFKEVNDQVKELRSELAAVKAKVETSGKEKTWDDLTLDELKVARDHYREQNNSAAVDFVNDKIVERKAQEVHSHQSELAEFNKVRTASWTEVVSAYPELKDKESQHYKETVALVESDARYNREPEGHALAARLVAERLLKEKLQTSNTAYQTLKQRILKSTKKDALETGGRSGNGMASLDKLRDAAESSGNPNSREWTTYLKALDEVKKKG